MSDVILPLVVAGVAVIAALAVIAATLDFLAARSRDSGS